MLSFKEWLKTTDYHSNTKNDKGFCAYSILNDDSFPIACEKYVMYKYLWIITDEPYLKYFEELYDEYIKFISRRFCDENPHDDCD